jgi:hypothetical protein
LHRYHCRGALPGVAFQAVMAVIPMKAPTPTFKAELEAYRQKLLVPENRGPTTVREPTW